MPICKHFGPIKDFVKIKILSLTTKLSPTREGSRFTRSAICLIRISKICVEETKASANASNLEKIKTTKVGGLFFFTAIF